MDLRFLVKRWARGRETTQHKTWQSHPSDRQLTGGIIVKNGSSYNCKKADQEIKRWF